MIDPKLLTPESGFVEGCAVEVVWGQSGPHRNELAYWDDAKEWSTEYMESIRPLSGPMAIWNFAPKWAEASIKMDDGQIRFYKVSNLHDVEKVSPGTEYRPFWAKEQS